MIATNFRRYPEALAVQLCLDFGNLVRWATERPGSRVLRAIRAARAQAAAALPFVAPWIPPLCIEPDASAPAWFKAVKHAAKALAAKVRAATGTLFQEQLDWVRAGTVLKRVVTGFQYAAESAKPVLTPGDTRRLVCNYQAGDSVLYMGQWWTVIETNVTSYTDEHDDNGESIIKPGALRIALDENTACERCVWPGWLSPESY